MPHSYNKIWIHVIFATKDRQHLILPKIEQHVYGHMTEQLVEMNCPPRIINGMQDHVHLLFSLNPQKAITDVLKQVKGNTAHWINEQNLIMEKFAWQTGYAAYSVSESQLEHIYNYIANQKRHHEKKTFMQEYTGFIKLHGFDTSGING